ncbi:MAG: hypothetical protein ACLFPQ_04550 [Candidatus Woesearchaeota archaeon]
MFERIAQYIERCSIEGRLDTILGKLLREDYFNTENPFESGEYMVNTLDNLLERAREFNKRAEILPIDLRNTITDSKIALGKYNHNYECGHFDPYIED